MAAKQSEALQTAKEACPVSELLALIEKANRGKENGPEVKALRRFIDDHPDMNNHHNVLSYSLQHALMLKITPEPGHLELLDREYKMRRDDLGWKDANPMERLMIERVMLCWLRVVWCENYNANYQRGGVVISGSEYADKLFARAFARYVKSVEALAKLRQVQAITKAADAQASLLEMKEKTTRARIEAAHPGLLSGDKGLKAVLKHQFV